MFPTKYTLYVCMPTDLLEKYWENVLESRRIIGDSSLGIKPGEDSGFDLYIPEETTIDAGDTKLINTLVKCKMTKSFKNVYNEIEEIDVGYYLYPRSSIYKTPLRMANSVGIIDSGYRGTIRIPLSNIPNVAKYFGDIQSGNDVSEYNYTIPKYNRLVQICSPDLSPFKVKFVENLDSTSRGEGGFGSTGR